MATRYIAQWVSASHDEEAEYATREFKTLESAKRCAMREGRKAGECPWSQVDEQRSIQRSDDLGSFTQWTTVNRWQGDWDDLDEVGC